MLLLFGLFSGKKSSKDKAMEKAARLADQGNWSEASTYYLDVLDEDPTDASARGGLRKCREKLVALNLEEARALKEGEPERAADHARLALELAADERDLAEEVRKVLASLEAKAPRKQVRKENEKEKPSRLGASSCSCASPTCGSAGGEEENVDADLEDLFGFYMESLGADEQKVFEALGGAFPEGFVALQQGDSKSARRLFLKVRKEGGDSVGICYALGLLEGLEGRIREAEKFFAQASGLDPTFAPAVRQRASILREMKRSGEAADLLASHLASQPDDRDALTLRVACLLDVRKDSEAEETLRPAYEKEGRTDMTVALLWARLKEQQGDRKGAIAAYETVTARNQDFLDALMPLGALLLAEGGKGAERAVKVFKHCYRIDPDHGWYHLLRVAEAYAALGWLKEARQMLDSSRDELPEDPRAEAAWEETAARLEKTGG